MVSTEHPERLPFIPNTLNPEVKLFHWALSFGIKLNILRWSLTGRKTLSAHGTKYFDFPDSSQPELGNEN